MRDVCALWCCCKSGAETSRLPDVHLEAWCELTHLARLAEGAGITMAAVVPREWLGSVIVRRRAAGVRAKRGARETTAGELCHGASTRGGGQLGEVVAPGAVHGPGAARRLCCGRPQIARCDPARRLVHLEHAREERSTSRARAGAGAGAGASAAGRPHKELHKMAKRGDKRFEFRSGRCSRCGRLVSGMTLLGWARSWRFAARARRAGPAFTVMRVTAAGSHFGGHAADWRLELLLLLR